MAYKLTPAEAKKIQQALAAARQGGGVLSDLAEAHVLAQRGRLTGTIAELRAHIRALVPVNTSSQILKTVGFGMLMGILTNLTLNSLNYYQPQIYKRLFSPPRVTK